MKKNARQGQTVVEFAFISLIFLFMLVLTLNIVLAFCYQQYFSFAAFMAARAYQASDQTPDEQYERAVLTLHRYIPKLSEKLPSSAALGTDINHPVIFEGFLREGVVLRRVDILPKPKEGNFGPIPPIEGGGSGSQAAFIGLTFEVPMAQIPLGQRFEKLRTIELEARSYLGREASESEVKRFFLNFFTATGAGFPENSYPKGPDAEKLSLNMSDNGF